MLSVALWASLGQLLRDVVTTEKITEGANPREDNELKGVEASTLIRMAQHHRFWMLPTKIVVALLCPRPEGTRTSVPSVLQLCHSSGYGCHQCTF